MIQFTPIRYDVSESASHVRTHVLTPRLWATLSVTIEWQKENIISILEDHILETISGVEWNSEDSDKDFTYLTENYNRFIRNLEPADIANISVIISLLRENSLTISAIWNATAYLVEGDEVTAIATPERGRFDFHTLTTGEVSRNASIYLSNKNIHDILGDDLLLEFSDMNPQELENVANEMFEREIDFSFHLIRVAHSFKSAQREIKPRGRGQLDLLKNKSANAAEYVKSMPIWKNTKEKISQKIDQVNFEENRQQKYIFLGVGALILFILVYILLSAIGGGLGGGTDTAKAKILEAKTLIEDSTKLTSDQSAFENNISKAEALLASLRAEKKYLTDVESLQNKIDVAKKEVYGIEIIELSKKESIVPIANTGFEPIGTFEINNKFLLVGKNGIITDYVRGMSLPKVLTYPSGTKAIASDIGDHGLPFIISEAWNVMTKRQDAVVNLSVSGQTNWELGKKIHEFNGNLYTINADQNQIYKYKPSANGFSAKTNVLGAPSNSKILDISIDGGFYLLLSDGKIGRFLSTKADAWIVGLTLNKIPGSWTINPSEESEMIATENLSYLYIRNGKKIWIFQPNSRSFQDVNALTYVAELEVQTESNILDISVPRDGLLYISTDTWVFETQFEVKDSKLYIK